MVQRGARVKQPDAIRRLQRPAAKPQRHEVLGHLLGGLRLHVQEGPGGREPDTDDRTTGHTWGREGKWCQSFRELGVNHGCWDSSLAAKEASVWRREKVPDSKASEVLQSLTYFARPWFLP